MRNTLNELATKVGFEVVNVDDGFINYEYNERVSGVESISYIIKVADKATKSEQLLTFDAIPTQEKSHKTRKTAPCRKKAQSC